MLLDVLSKKFFWGALCSVALIGGGYRYYLTTMGPAAVTAAIDKEANDHFVSCVAAVEGPSYSLIKHCDEFFLDYLPKKTSPSYKQKIVEVKFSFSDSQLVIATYQKLSNILEEMERDAYPSLGVLSNGQIEVDNT
ncbi:hypothetical protein [Vibrio owensii]|uniref:hypothetical protein n=1 Tax=Vibrio owensii TaxID=696485 RepID=UPI0018F267B2|nr:hypothetical protein [Vibrio owensii]